MSEIAKRIEDFGNFPFIFIFIAFTLFFLVTGPSFFETWNSSNNQLITVYLILMVVFIIWAKKGTREYLKTPTKRAIPGFLLGMFITFLLLNLLMYFKFMSIPTFPPELFWITVVMQMCVVAPAEEIIFRGVWLEYTGVIISSIMFAIWHSYAYGFIWYKGDWASFNWNSLLIAFIIGMVLALIVKQSQDINKKRKIYLGLPCTIAIHATYNLCVLGAFYLGV